MVRGSAGDARDKQTSIVESNDALKKRAVLTDFWARPISEMRTGRADADRVIGLPRELAPCRSLLEEIWRSPSKETIPLSGLLLDLRLIWAMVVVA